jgi:outer membrane protein assembly factor BamB
MRSSTGKHPTGKARLWALLALAVVFPVVAVGAIILSNSTQSSSQRVGSPGSNALSSFDPSNTRYVEGPIGIGSVSDLVRAWSRPAKIGEYYASSPVVYDGVIYSQDLASNVEAIDLKGGKTLWKRPYESFTQGPNGVIAADDYVYGATATDAFALNRKTGKELWATTLTRSDSELVAMAPGVHDGLVYVSTTPASEGGGIGTLWALDGKTGEKEWSFDTVPKSLWGNPRLNSGGGLSYRPAFDSTGAMYVGIGGPGPVPGTKQYPWGSSRPGPNLYTSSILKLDAKTGELQWHYQLTPHALCQWGLEGPPILIKTPERDLAIATGRSGIVIALEQQTGKLIWKRSVGRHNGHDDDGLYAMRSEYDKLHTPMTVYPGAEGGIAAPSSTNGSSIFVPVTNAATTLLSQTEARPGKSLGGELVALDVRTGAVEWIHSFSSGLTGGTTAVNDVVFASTQDGPMHAFDAVSGKKLWGESLAPGVRSGVTVSGDTLVASSGYEGKVGIVAYRLDD